MAAASDGPSASASHYLTGQRDAFSTPIWELKSETSNLMHMTVFLSATVVLARAQSPPPRANPRSPTLTNPVATLQRAAGARILKPQTWLLSESGSLASWGKAAVQANKCQRRTDGIHGGAGFLACQTAETMPCYHVAVSTSWPRRGAGRCDDAWTLMLREGRSEVG